MAKRLRVGGALLALALLPGCTWDSAEPGLFPERKPSARASAPSRDKDAPAPTNPALPVAGEQVWTTADGNQITVRIAVHAVRRTDDATVLDWSVTPIAAPNRKPGERLPGTTDLGLTGSGSNIAVVLVDSGARQAYRPLSHRSRRFFNHCLCTPLWLTQQTLRLGVTSLMQVAYPPLPTSLGFVDVVFGTVAATTHVPVTGVGQIPTAPQPTDLTRPAATQTAAAPAVSFVLPGTPERRESIQIDQITATPGLTSVAWTLRSQNRQDNTQLQPYGPPVGTDLAGRLSVVNTNPTDGLTLRVGGGEPATAWWMTAEVYGRAGHECLCTELGLWASDLRDAGGQTQVVTTYAGLRAGTTAVDVVLPGIATLPKVPVTPVVDAASRLGAPTSVIAGVWAYGADNPPTAWASDDWPTPLPASSQLTDYQAAVETIGPLPRV